MYDRLGFGYEILDAGQMRRRWPDLTPESDVIGLHDALGGYSEPHEFVPALARRCRDLGVEIRENARVDGLQIDSGRVVGVQTGMGGAGSRCGDLYGARVDGGIHGALRVRLPIKSFVHQRYVLRSCQSGHRFRQSMPIPTEAISGLRGWVRPTSAYWLEGRPRTEKRSASTILRSA